MEGSKEETLKDTVLQESEIESEYEYVEDNEYTGPPYHSQPCHSLGGLSYTPPGWKRVYKNKHTLSKCKRLKLQ